jgi:hypothetical protein
MQPVSPGRSAGGLLERDHEMIYNSLVVYAAGEISFQAEAGRVGCPPGMTPTRGQAESPRCAGDNAARIESNLQRGPAVFKTGGMGRKVRAMIYPDSSTPIGAF